MPGNHSSVVGGSSAARVLACPGSIPLVAEAPKSPSSIYADEGTALHSAMEYLLDTTIRRKRKVGDLLGLTFNKHVITEELIRDAVQPAYEYFQQVIGEKGYAYEQEIEAAFPSIDGAFGTTDVVAFRSEESIIIFDWKFGAGVPVSAEMNAQLMFYACCALEHYGLWRKVKIIDMHICQPRIKDGNSRCVIDIKQLRAFKHSLIRAIGQTRLETGPHCRWCDAAAFTCPLKKEEAAEGLKWKAAGKDLAELADNLESLEDLVRSIKSAIHTTLEKGGTVKNWKLVEKRATRKWAIDDPQVRTYLRGYGLTEDEVAPRSTVSPAQAEKLLKPKGEKLESSRIKVESSGYTVAPESDKRPAVSTGRDLDALASFIEK